MPHLLIHHEVTDFATWKSAYDAHKPTRQAAGLTDLHLWSDEDDPNDVYILFEAADSEQALDFAESEDLVEVMEAAGVVGEPEIVILEPLSLGF